MKVFPPTTTDLFHFLQVFTQEELDSEEQKQRCRYLNEERANFTICCEYPTIVMWRFQQVRCQEECQKATTIDNCCASLCNYRTIGFIPKTSQSSTFDPTKGLTYSFALSIGNSSNWMDIIETACTNCYENTEKTDDFDSCGIPLSLFTVIDCAYSEMFIKCAEFNPHRIEECALTKEYVRDCL